MRPQQTPQSSIPPVVAVLLAANIGVFVLQNVSGGLLSPFALWPIGRTRPPEFELWQLVTYGFLHASTTHLFFNMFAMWMFGRQIEWLWGSVHFAGYYMVCVVGAGLVQLVASYGTGQPTIGASGGVFGLLLAYGLMFPNHTIMPLFPPIPMKAKWFVLLYGILELWLGVTGSGSSIAHFAHLGGMLFGFILIQYWRGRMPWKPKYILRR